MALAEKISLRSVLPKRSGDVVLGDEFVTPGRDVQEKVRVQRERRRFFSLKPSALRRKIVTFNLIALNVLVAGVLYQNSSRDSLALQRANGIVAEAELIADVFEAQLPTGAPVNLATGDGIDVKATMNGLDLHSGVELFVFDRAEVLVGDRKGTGRRTLLGDSDEIKSRTYISDFLSQLWGYVAAPFALGADEVVAPDAQEQVRKLVTATLNSGSQIETGQGGDGAIFAVATPILHDGQAIGVVALASITGEIDYLVRSERERVLQMFVIATLVSIGLSLVLASTIANPLADLAAAAEVGRERNHRGYGSGRIRIPDLTARPDEIGRLSGALRGMVSALYERIESNEEFAADVSHEIKNPLASLRSAVGTLRVAKRDDQREKLLQVIEHDVQRLDRLVSDISNASRLDSEFVKEEEKPFDLLTLLGNLSKHLGEQAREKGVDFISDLPRDPIILNGLEQRLAQVFVNLISNAISFCEEGDAIRVWARRRENRVLIVVEDTGPGIPDQALTKVFKRFYSERPEGQFGNNSGLGLSISKQIVEAHGGVIWAENIRPTDADVTSDPLGARFVVGLPV